MAKRLSLRYIWEVFYMGLKSIFKYRICSKSTYLKTFLGGRIGFQVRVYTAHVNKSCTLAVPETIEMFQT